MNAKLHAICDSQGRPINLFVTAGPVSDYNDALTLLGGLTKVEWLHNGIRASIPRRKQCKTPVKYDRRRYKRRNRIEIIS